MSNALYMDENVSERIVRGLRRRGINVLTAEEDGMGSRPDPEVMDRATSLGCIAVSEDEDFLIEAAQRQETGQHFSGVIRCPQGLPAGTAIENLELIARATLPSECDNQVIYLPL